VKLEKGKMTETPVKTQFGYHVIKVEDTRPVKLPTLDEAKPRIVQVLQAKRLDQLQTDLRGKAKVQ
jgi:peptidyl-prolyl cis-trans isomerase C